MIYDKEPIYDMRPAHYRSIFEIKSRSSIPHLVKQLRLWEGVLDRSRWSQRYPTELSIIIANRNIRKIQMLLMIKQPKWDHRNNIKVGRLSFDYQSRHFILKSFNYRCADCGKTKDETTLHIDHIIPISRGGSNKLTNLQVLCKDCNLAKHTDVWEAGK